MRIVFITHIATMASGYSIPWVPSYGIFSPGHEMEATLYRLESFMERTLATTALIPGTNVDAKHRIKLIDKAFPLGRTWLGSE